MPARSRTSYTVSLSALIRDALACSIPCIGPSFFNQVAASTASGDTGGVGRGGVGGEGIKRAEGVDGCDCVCTIKSHASLLRGGPYTVLDIHIFFNHLTNHACARPPLAR